MVAKRGIMFEFQTSVSPAAAKAFEALEKRAEELQKRMNLTLNVVERGRRNGANGTNGHGANGSSAVSNADIKAAERAAQARERAAERAFRTEARWNRQAEAAIARREAAEEKAARNAERDAKRSADAKIREAKRAEQATQKEFSAAARRQKAEALREQKADREFWKGVERFGGDRAKLKIDAEKQAAAEQKKAAREKQQADREAELSARKAAEAQNKIREGVYGTVHAFGQLTRAAAQFGLVGQRDMSRVLDTIFAVEGSINALQGVMGAVRAIGGMRGAGGGGVGKLGPAAALSGGAFAKNAAHLLKSLGIRSFGVAGGLGLVGAGVGAAALGTAGLAGAMIDRRRGVAGNVGGFWDTIGMKGLGAASSVAGLGVRALSATESAFNSPYGLTSRERELRSEKITQGTFRDEQVRNLPLIKTLAATGVLDNILSDQETERRERFRAEDERKLAEKREREEFRERISAPGNAAIYRAEREQRYQAYQLRSAGRYARAELFGDFRNRAFGRQQEAHEEQLQLQERRALGQYVSPAQARRAADEDRREQEVVERFSGRRIQELRNQRAANDTRGGALQTEFNTAKAEYDRLKAKQQIAPGSDVFGLQDVESAAPARIAAAYDKMKAVESQLLENTNEREQLTAKIKESEIEGAQRALQIHERDYASAKRKADSLRDQRQSAKERFGQLLPEQQRSLIEAAEAMRSGHANRLQAERLRQFGDLFEPELRQFDERNAERGGFDDRLLGASSLPGRLGTAEAQEIKLHVTFDEREAVRVKLEEESTRRARETADTVIQLLRQVFEHERTETNRLIEEKLYENTRQQAEQGRALYGVG